MAVTIDGRYFDFPNKSEVDDAGMVVLESSASASVVIDKNNIKNTNVSKIENEKQ